MSPRVLLVFLIIRPRQDGPGQQDFGDSEHDPEWLQNAMAFNEDHANRHQHRMITHDLAPLPYLPFQIKYCKSQTGENEDADTTKTCLAKFNRDNNTWKKFDILYQHLLENDAEYVLFMDVDSVIAHPNQDTLTKMSAELTKSGMDLMLADEDWRNNGNQTINTGVMLAKNTEWTKNFLKELIALRTGAQCQKNEQLCLNGLYKSNKLESKQHLYVASGSRWNRHPRLDPFGAEAEITHFMGGGKGSLSRIDMYKCGHCPCLHGVCKYPTGSRGACFDVNHCATQNKNTNLRLAFVVADGLSNPYSDPRRVSPETLEDMKVMASGHDADLVLIIPDKFGTSYPLVETERQQFEESGIVLRESSAWRSADSGLEESNQAHAERKVWFHERPKPHWLVLQTLGLVDYDAVVHVDRSIRISGNYTNILRCAARSKFLGSAGYGSPFNSMMFALKPNKLLFDAALHYAAHASYSDERGWSDGGWWPAQSAPIRLLDGFFWTFFYKNGKPTALQPVIQAFAEVDIEPYTAYQIDPSEWRAKEGEISLYRTLKTPGCDGRVFTKRIVT